MRRSDCIDVSLEMLYDHLLVILGMIYIYIYIKREEKRGNGLTVSFLW